VALAVAVASPLHQLGETLLSAHMVQHELLILVAAPLLVLSRPAATMLWAFPPRLRQRLGKRVQALLGRWAQWLVKPAVAFILHAATILIWHLSGPYNASLTSAPLHAVEHLSFFVTALLFWWALVCGPQARREQGGAIVYLSLTAAYSGALGMVLTFARAPLYSWYIGRTEAWGLTALADQQLAGLLMWIPGGLVYLVAALWLARYGIRASEIRVARREAEAFVP
jgi:cytochrome c oxidase assembly factor CtaG